MNVQGTLNILEAAREIKVSTNGSKKMASVFAPSSIAVFGPSTPQDGTPDDVEKSGNDYVDQFIHKRAEGPIQMAVTA